MKMEFKIKDLIGKTLKVCCENYAEEGYSPLFVIRRIEMHCNSEECYFKLAAYRRGQSILLSEDEFFELLEKGKLTRNKEKEGFWHDEYLIEDPKLLVNALK